MRPQSSKKTQKAHPVRWVHQPTNAIRLSKPTSAAVLTPVLMRKSRPGGQASRLSSVSPARASLIVRLTLPPILGMRAKAPLRVRQLLPVPCPVSATSGNHDPRHARVPQC